MRTTYLWPKTRLTVLTLISCALLYSGCGDDTQQPRRDSQVDVRKDSSRRDHSLPDEGLDGTTLDHGQDQATSDMQEDGPPTEGGTDLHSDQGNDGLSPYHDRCVNAEPIVLSGGQGNVSGDTSSMFDEFPTLKCGGLSALVGPQLYFTVDMQQGKTYRIDLKPDFSAYFYVFSSAANCMEASIQKDCDSNGKTGAKGGYVSSSSTGSLFFKPTTAGTYYIAVDSTSSLNTGAFTLDLTELDAPTNSLCSAPQLLDPSTSPVTVNGTTTGSVDEFPTVDCGGSTALDGPQVYYQFEALATKTYKITLAPEFSAYAYVFSAAGGCNPTPINTYCGSGGATGISSGSISAGKSKAIYFTPNVPGSFIIAVDSSASSNHGDFVLTLEEAVVPSNGTCAKAIAVSFSGGKATITGTTAGLKDEFSSLKCGGYSTLDGSQAYYQVPLNMDKGYRITVSSDFDCYAYLFSSAATCQLSGIEADCASGGATGDLFGSIPAGSPKTYFFTPAASGTYTLAIDSSYSSDYGDFTVEIEEYTLPTNRTCAKASTVTLVDGKATISESTAGVADEFSTLDCGEYTYLDGPQLYYRLSMTTDRVYRFRLQPTFTAHLYLFRTAANCQESAIQTDCSSKGLTGNKYTSVSANQVKAFYFQPTTAGDYIFAVDSNDSSSSGDFILDIEELMPVTNGTCATALPVTLQNGQVVIEGDTFGTTNEFGTDVKCSSSGLDGPQVYYQVDLQANVTYKFNVTTLFTGYFYVFPASANCQAADIEAACSSKGGIGDKVYVSSSTKTLSFTPSSAGTYYFAMDSTSTDWGYYGFFTGDIKEWTPPVPPTFTAPLSWSFETDCMGLSTLGDWECGLLNFTGGTNCDSTETPPSAGHSGTGMWGTKLNDCYTPMENNANYSSCTNTDTTDDSILSFQVTLPGTWSQGSLTYWSWDDYYQPYDWYEVRVNGTPAFQACSSSSSAPSSWKKNTIDLAAYVGQTVTVAFHFMASGVTNYAGLYLDDLTVNGQ